MNPQTPASENTMHVSFRIEGDFMTKLAREKLYHEKDMKHAIDLVMSIIGTDEMSYEERLGYAIGILDGKYSMTGTYPGPDYRMEEHNDYTPLGFYNMLSIMNERMKKAEKALADERGKINFILSHMSSYDQKKMHHEYYDETGEYLQADVTIDPYEGMLGSMLESFLERQKNIMTRDSDGEDDYGWIDPDGEFYPVAWANHEEWAEEWLKENIPNNEENAHVYEFDDGISRPSRDILIYKLGWVLLHSPYRGIAFPTKAPLREMTKAQKETLYDYYIERDLKNEANAIYEEDT